MSEEQNAQEPYGDEGSKEATDERADVPSQETNASEEEEGRASPKKRTIIFAVGLFLLVVGFLVLNQANPAADNMAGKVSPLLILGGYGVIFWSLWI